MPCRCRGDDKWGRMRARRQAERRRARIALVRLLLVEVAGAALGLVLVCAVTPSPAHWGTRYGLYVLWLATTYPIIAWWAKERWR